MERHLWCHSSFPYGNSLVMLQLPTRLKHSCDITVRASYCDTNSKRAPVQQKCKGYLITIGNLIWQFGTNNGPPCAWISRKCLITVPIHQLVWNKYRKERSPLDVICKEVLVTMPVSTRQQNLASPLAVAFLSTNKLLSDPPRTYVKLNCS